MSRHRYVSAYSIAGVYAGLDDKDQTFQWLEKSYQEHNPDLIPIKVDPLFDNVHEDQRFVELLRRMGLQP